MRENTRCEVDEPMSTPTLSTTISSSSTSERPVLEKKMRPPICSSVVIQLHPLCVLADHDTARCEIHDQPMRVQQYGSQQPHRFVGSGGSSELGGCDPDAHVLCPAEPHDAAARKYDCTPFFIGELDWRLHAGHPTLEARNFRVIDQQFSVEACVDDYGKAIFQTGDG